MKKTFPKFGNGKGIKKSIPIIRERESEAFILGSGREREFPLTPAPVSASKERVPLILSEAREAETSEKEEHRSLSWSLE